jgi:hypothetical protein
MKTMAKMIMKNDGNNNRRNNNENENNGESEMKYRIK